MHDTPSLWLRYQSRKNNFSGQPNHFDILGLFFLRTLSVAESVARSLGADCGQTSTPCLVSPTDRRGRKSTTQNITRSPNEDQQISGTFRGMAAPRLPRTNQSRGRDQPWQSRGSRNSSETTRSLRRARSEILRGFYKCRNVLQHSGQKSNLWRGFSRLTPV